MTRAPYPKVAFAAAIAALGFAAGAAAQTGMAPSGVPGKPAGNLQGADRTFVMKAAQGGLAEVEAGKVARQRAQNDSVKQFAQRMVTDHSKANEELAALAKSKGVEVPGALDKQHQAHMEKLGKLPGPSFDREYMKHRVDDHSKTVADFEMQSKSGRDAELKQWAGSKLPALKEHLKLAQDTQSRVSKTGGAGADAKSTGKSDQSKAVNSANPTASTQGSNTGNVAGAAPKPATTGK